MAWFGSPLSLNTAANFLWSATTIRIWKSKRSGCKSFHPTNSKSITSTASRCGNWWMKSSKKFPTAIEREFSLELFGVSSGRNHSQNAGQELLGEQVSPLSFLVAIGHALVAGTLHLHWQSDSGQRHKSRNYFRNFFFHRYQHTRKSEKACMLFQYICREL